ncbi:MAG: GlcG/HbpS family heme-binding protein [Acetobacteraceae bacterium]
MNRISLDQATRIIDAALTHAAGLKLKPLSIAVLDAGGHLVAFKCQDGSAILRPQIAHGKAWGALGMGLGGRALAARAQKAPNFFASLASASDGRLIPGTGGVLIRSSQGEVLGAVGVSGDLPDHDEACAVRGIEQAGLTADPGEETV